MSYSPLPTHISDEYWNVYRSRECLPEARLWIAVLGRALDDLKSGRARVRDDAREWFESTEVAVNSFEGVCSVLGMNPGAAREAILSHEGKWRDWRSFKP